MGMIISKSFLISVVILFALLNPVIDSNKISDTNILDDTDFNDSIEIDVCGYYNLEDIYPLYSASSVSASAASCASYSSSPNVIAFSTASRRSIQTR